MSNLTVKLNLAGLKHVVRKEKRKDGTEVECLIIPIEVNNLYRGTKGMYLDLSLIEVKNKSNQPDGSKDTHLIKQNLSKEVYQALSEDQRKAMPILGNAIEWTGGTNEAPIVEQDDSDDLPF